MKNPLISIIIPVKNRGHTIVETLKSIKFQTYKNFELIIVDDVSSDDSIKVIKNFSKKNKLKCKVVQLKESSGASKARNVGAANAKGEVLVFTDSDIVLFKDALKKGIEYRNKNPNVSAFFGTFTTSLRFKNFLSQYKHLYLCYLYSKQGEERSTLDTSLSFIDKKLFDKFKFDDNLKISEDAELAMRMIKEGHVIKQSKDIEMEHIKHYSIKSFIYSEFMRGKRFSRLLLKSIFNDRVKSGKKTFYLKPINFYLNVGIFPFLVLFLFLSLIFKHLFLLLLSTATFLLLIVLNLEFWNYLRKQNGWLFGTKSIFITFFDMAIMDLGITVTFIEFLIFGKNLLK